MNRATTALSSAVFGLDGNSAGTILPTELRVAVRILIAAAGVAVAASLDIISGPGLHTMFYLPAILLVTLIAGWQAGVACYLASIAFGWYQARGEIMPLDFFVLVAALMLGIAVALRRILVQMKQSEARLRSLVEASSGVVFTTDRGGQIRQPHPGITERTGIPWDGYRGLNWRQALHPEDIEALPKTLLPSGTNSFVAEIRVQHSDTGEWRWYRVRALPLTGADGDVREWVGSLTDIHEARLAREQRELLVGELRHRMKNLLTVIGALAKSSRSDNDANIDAFLTRFLGRLNALGTAADIVLASNRVSIETGAVVRATLSPFGEPARFHVEGPKVQLSEQTGGALAMAVHELATNALKYGALSVPEGSVAIVWTCSRIEDGERFVFEWTERGGPPALAPNKHGFGTRLIGFVPLHEKAGDVKIEYRPEGLYCRIEFTKVPGQPSVASAAAT